MPSRTGSPLWSSRPSSAFGRLTGNRSTAANLYLGKEPYGKGIERAISRIGQYGPSLEYDVRCSRTGSPLGTAKRTPGFARAKRHVGMLTYEGKDATVAKLGQFGPGMYDVRVSKTGSPRGEAKRTPTFGGREGLTSRDKCFNGKQMTTVGKFGPTAANAAPQCSNRGSPLWKRGPCSAAFAMPHVRRVRAATTAAAA